MASEYLRSRWALLERHLETLWRQETINATESNDSYVQGFADGLEKTLNMIRAFRDSLPPDEIAAMLDDLTGESTTDEQW